MNDQIKNAARQGQYDLLQKQIEINLGVMHNLAVDAMDDLADENKELRDMVLFLEKEQKTAQSQISFREADIKEYLAKILGLEDSVKVLFQERNKLTDDIQTLNHALGEAEKSKLEMFDLVKEINDALGLGDGTTREQVLEAIKNLRASQKLQAVPGSRWTHTDTEQAEAIEEGFIITVTWVDEDNVHYRWDKLKSDEVAVTGEMTTSNFFKAFTPLDPVPEIKDNAPKPLSKWVSKEFGDNKAGKVVTVTKFTPQSNEISEAWVDFGHEDGTVGYSTLKSFLLLYEPQPAQEEELPF